MALTTRPLERVEAICRELDGLKRDFDAAFEPDYRGYPEITEEDARRFRVRARAAIERHAPVSSAYAREIADITAAQAHVSWEAGQFMAIVAALADDYRAGALQGVSELIHAEVFDDLLDQAAELLDRGYINPAAVLAGGVLEDHLRKLAAKNEIPLELGDGKPHGFDRLTVELRKREVLSEPLRKALVAAYALRNDAAHGKPPPASGDAQRMIDTVRDFVARLPA